VTYSGVKEDHACTRSIGFVLHVFEFKRRTFSARCQRTLLRELLKKVFRVIAQLTHSKKLAPRERFVRTRFVYSVYVKWVGDLDELEGRLNLIKQGGPCLIIMARGNASA